MYVQVIRGTVRDGGWEQLADLTQRWSAEPAAQAPGFREMHFLREVNTEDRVVFLLMWESREDATALGGRQEVEIYFRQLTDLIEEDPKFLGAETVTPSW